MQRYALRREYIRTSEALAYNQVRQVYGRNWCATSVP